MAGILHLNRWFFIQAIKEMPENPFEHPFSYSVRIVLESSHDLIEGLRDVYQYQPTITTSFRPFWTHAFSAAVCGAVLRLHVHYQLLTFASFYCSFFGIDGPCYLCRILSSKPSGPFVAVIPELRVWVVQGDEGFHGAYTSIVGSCPDLLFSIIFIRN